MPRNKQNSNAQIEDEKLEEKLEFMHARKVISARLSRFCQFIEHQKKLENISDIDVFQLESRLKSVEEDFCEFDKIQTRIEYLISDEENERITMETAFYTQISEAKRLIANYYKFQDSVKIQNQAINPVQQQSSSAVVKLPDLGLPSFHGKYETWFSFKDIFDSVVNNRTDLSEIDKFLYLRLCCKDDALKLIESLDVTANNYTVALDLLTKRYENRRAIINTHINHVLFNLPTITRESAFYLRKLLDSLHQHLSALQKLNLPVDQWDVLLIPIVLQKVDDRTKRDWEAKQNDKNLPTFEEFTEFLTKKCLTLEALQNDSHKPNQSNLRESFSKPNTKEYSNQFNMKNTSNQFHSNSRQLSYASADIRCIICKAVHFIYQCPKFSNLSITEKYNEIRNHNLCSNCLRPGHWKPDCNSSGCKKCGEKHNTMLHIDRKQNRSFGERNNKSGNTVSTPTDDSRSSNFIREPTTSPNAPTSQFVDRTAAAAFAQTNNFEEISLATICTTGRNTCSSNLMVNEDISHSYANFNANQVLLSTAKVLIQNNDQEWTTCYALLDSGSQSNLITEKLCNKLNLKCEKIDIPLAGINQIETKISQKTTTKIKSRIEEFERELSFLVLPVLTERLPIVEFKKTSIRYPKNVKLADEQFNVPKQIDLILGAGIFFDLLKNNKIRLGDNLPILQATYLGWVFAGKLNVHEYKKTVCNFVSISNQDLHNSLTKFWQIEELNNNICLSKAEEYCEEYFKSTTKRHKNGQFIVKYPFKQNIDLKLGDSKSLALKRLFNLETRFKKNENLKVLYTEFMREYEKLNHMTFSCNLESDNSVDSESFFLPHSAVIRNSVTTKCRVVFDASAKSESGASLNDLILVGPTLQEDLFSILLRLRLRKIVLIADIKQMYRCILIDKEERRFQKILWRDNPTDTIKIYDLNTVTYGTASAPFQATRCLIELGKINKDKFPRTASIIENSFYMDDLLISVDSEQEAIQIYHELTEILSSAHFYLRKWSSNNRNILDYIILQAGNSDEEKLVLSHDEKELKTLGVAWNAIEDNLKYAVKITTDNKKITKRTVLSIISQIFDPLGLIGPVIITAKLIIQKLWLLKLDWDQQIPNDLKTIWLEFMSEIEYLNKIKFDRYVLLPNNEKIELCGFCDSSEKAYGACVYLVSFLNEKKEIRLLTAKSRVAPIKKQTLPRLELLAATLLAELVHRVKNILNIEISRITYFSDSTIVLAWLKTEPCYLKTFVANRVTKITELSNINSWRHVKSKDNIADVISRGLTPKQLLDRQDWFHGPTFLENENFDTDYSDANLSLEVIPELKSKIITLPVTETRENQDNSLFYQFKTLTSFWRLVHIFAFVCRFKNRCLLKQKIVSESLTLKEKIESQETLIRLAQQECFGQEISLLKSGKSLNKNSKILGLHPFLDSKNILRVGGRLSNADISYDQQHPLILPYKHKLTDLIILECHVTNLHVGTQALLSMLRLRYWPINGKNAVKRVTKYCLTCYKVKPTPCKYLMGELPSSRVNPSKPFSNCGIDYAGPIYIKEGTLRRCKLVKTYIAVFVCFSTRAIHIELVSNLTTNSFINALKRFCSRRGKPLQIFSDNGLNFVGANNQFMELYNLVNNKDHQNEIEKYLARDHINWNFIPARSPHMGGIWESAVKSIKYHLRRTLGEASLTFEETYTILTMIEACLNSRPLTPLSNDINDYVPLTPSHFLIGESLSSLPEENIIEERVNRLTRFQRIQTVYTQFWHRWSREYLAQLQTRYKWKTQEDEKFKIGSLVILVEDNTPPLRWPMARITEIHRGPDNIARVVSVRLSSGHIVNRTLKKVCVLPLPAEDTDDF